MWLCQVNCPSGSVAWHCLLLCICHSLCHRTQLVPFACPAVMHCWEFFTVSLVKAATSVQLPSAQNLGAQPVLLYRVTSRALAVCQPAGSVAPGLRGHGLQASSKGQDMGSILTNLQRGCQGGPALVHLPPNRRQAPETNQLKIEQDGYGTWLSRGPVT